MERVCDMHWLWAVIINCNYKRDCSRRANKSNHPIQTPLLLLTESRTRDTTIHYITSRRSWVVGWMAEELRFDSRQDNWGISLLHRVQIGSGASPLFCSICLGGSSQRALSDRGLNLTHLHLVQKLRIGEICLNSPVYLSSCRVLTSWRTGTTLYCHVFLW
jgi:hypothetical protein